jgi:hypothetical protein
MRGGTLVRGGVVVVQQQTQTAFPTAFKNLKTLPFLNFLKSMCSLSLLKALSMKGDSHKRPMDSSNSKLRLLNSFTSDSKSPKPERSNV